MLSSDLSKSSTIVISANQDRKVFRPKRKTISGIPSDISENPELLKAIQVLPANYNFEIPKTIWRIKKCQSQCVALQFPEGLLIYALTISDILENFTGVQTVIMGDVTYGACCIDDFTARALGADLMVHYGHSCLIPVNVTKNINMLYIFVDIKIDNLHVINTIQKNFDQQSPIALVSTIQFVSTLQHVAVELRGLGYSIQIPQCKPLSPGEVLGCTSPEIKNADIVIFVGDGRFHLESAMIKNPSLTFYRYNPYDKTITEEKYDYEKMTSIRKKTVERATQSKIFGLILGTLGRQGSPLVLENITTILKKYKRTFVTVLLSEIFPEKLNLISHVDSWIQVACPRLSIDWGSAFSQPLLTPYELVVVMKEIEWQQKYPMDFYASQSLGVWTPNHKDSNLKASCGTCKDCSCEKQESKTNV